MGCPLLNFISLASWWLCHASIEPQDVEICATTHVAWLHRKYNKFCVAYLDK